MNAPRPTDRAYVDAPIVDPVAAAQAAHVAAEALGLSPPTPVRVGMNAIHRSGDVALRVSLPTVDAAVSLELAAFWRRRGLRVPNPIGPGPVSHGGLQVTAWEWIEESDGPIDWEAVGAAIRTVHATPAEDLPDGVPLPSPVMFPWWDFDALLSRTAREIDGSARAGLVAAVERHRDWSTFDDVVVCHGDLQPGNVITTPEGPVVIDWDLLCAAPPGWDHGPLITWETRWGGAPGAYAAYASGYGRSFADDAPTQAFAELRLVAATLMRAVAAGRDPAAGPELEQRLRYWRGERDAPMWSPQ